MKTPITISEIIEQAKKFPDLQPVLDATSWDSHTMYNQWGFPTDDILKATSVVSKGTISAQEILKNGAPRLR